MPAREAWGLDLGQTALHAVKVRRGKGGDAEIIDCFFRPFEAELDDPDLDSKVEEALEEFVEEKKVGNTPVVASLPAFTTIFRDFPLPAVSDSRLAEIVSYEAKQIIPFPLEETVWDYQKVRTDEDTGEVGIALICCRRDIIEGVLATLDDAGLNIEALQVAPLGLVNYIRYESEPEGIVLVLDGGARGTDFVMINEESFWFRPIGVSGTDLTKALMGKFSIPYEEAEDLKCKMGDSKQADRVFRVVEPVLRSLVGDVQRSIGYYKSLFRGVRVDEVMTTGNTFLFPRMDGFLQENLGMPVKPVPEPENFEISADLDEDELADNKQVLGMAAGLALQGVGLAEINMSLLPPERRMQKLIRSKLKYGVGAVLLVALTVLVSYFYSASNAAQYKDLQESSKSANALANKVKADFASIKGAFGPEEKSNQALASITPTRGYLLESTAALYGTVQTLNAIMPNVSDAIEVEEKELFETKTKELKIDPSDTERLERLRKSVRYHLDWKYGRYGKIYLNKSAFDIVQVLYEKKVVDEAKKTTEWVFRRVLEKNKMTLDAEEERLETETRYMVRVSYEGFVVSATTADAIKFKQALFKYQGVLNEAGQFQFTMDPGTNRRPKKNKIRLPEITAPARKKAEEAMESSGLAVTETSATEKEIGFYATTERIVIIEGSFLYQPKVWPKREEQSPKAPEGAVSQLPVMVSRPERSI